MSNSIFFVRHGETAWKVLGLTQGQLDSPLTDRAREQALRCADELRMQSISRVVSSPLGRALVSAQVIASELAMAEPVVESRFVERDDGMLQGSGDVVRNWSSSSLN